MPPEIRIRKGENLAVPQSEFVAMLEERWSRGNLLCVGLDSDPRRIPDGLSQFEFNKRVVDVTQDLVCAYKPNSAFYEAQLGQGGMEALVQTVNYIHDSYPGIPVILDAKRADILNTNLGYIKYAFDQVKADAVTVHPYLGREALGPFLDRGDKGIIVLVRTSNPEAGELQDLPVDLQVLSSEYIEKFGDLKELRDLTGQDVLPLYQVLAYRISRYWNARGNVGVVVGATYPRELGEVRHIVGPDVFILAPGLGKQGGKPEDLPLAYNDRGVGVIANNSSGIIFAKPEEGEGPFEAIRREAVKWHDEISPAKS